MSRRHQTAQLREVGRAARESHCPVIHDIADENMTLGMRT